MKPGSRFSRAAPICLLVIATVATGAAQERAPQKIAFNRVFPNAGQIGLFIAAADGSDERLLLAQPDIDYDPVWSPDGASIVFTSERGGSADLFRVNPDGSHLERLTDNTAYDDQAAFSPDGKQVVFVSTRGGGTADLWVMDLLTKRAKTLTSGPGGDFRPSWSPDGKWIAFSSDRQSTLPFAHGRWEHLHLVDLYVIRPDGSGLRPITKRSDFCGSPKWLPDGQRVLAYCMTAEQTLANRRPVPAPGSDTRLVSIDVVTGALSDVPAGAGVKMNPSPLPGGDVGYIRKDAADAGAGISYANGGTGPRGDVRAASWSPDGKRIVFHKRLTVPFPTWTPTFSRDPGYTLTLTGGQLPSFSPAGDRYVTNRRPLGSPLGAGLLIATTGADTFQVVYEDQRRNVLAPQWSPRGDAIIFGVGEFNAFFNGFNGLFLKPEDRVEGGAQVAIVNPDGTGFREVTTGPNNNGFPSMAPDGKRFVYRTFGSEGDGLRIMDLETKAVTRLTKGYDNFPLWSPRGDLITFSRQAEGDYEIYTIRPDGTSLKRLTSARGNDAHMAWSPDGEYIAFATTRMGFKDEVTYTDAPQPYGELFVMRYDGTRVQQLTDNQWEDGTPAWQPTMATHSAPSAQGQSPVVSPAKAPTGTETRPVEWVNVTPPGLRVMLAAIARPPGPGPFPTVIILHGTHGFAQQYVQLAQDLAQDGVLAVAACWFAGGSGLGSGFVTPIGCPDAPPMPTASSPEALRIIDALVQAARALPGARADRIGLVGHSRGGGAALHSILGSDRAQAVALDSAGYPSDLIQRVSQVNAPILLLHGTADSPADGGSALSTVQMARDFEAALRRAGKPVEVIYYDGGGHNSMFTSSTQYDDEVRRIIAFFRRHLQN